MGVEGFLGSPEKMSPSQETEQLTWNHTLGSENDLMRNCANILATSPSCPSLSLAPSSTLLQSRHSADPWRWRRVTALGCRDANRLLPGCRKGRGRLLLPRSSRPGTAGCAGKPGEDHTKKPETSTRGLQAFAVTSHTNTL